MPINDALICTIDHFNMRFMNRKRRKKKEERRKKKEGRREEKPWRTSPGHPGR
jgi:hypothetical protein